MGPQQLGRRALAEFIGTAFLVMAVIGSGIAATRLSPHDVGLELFENAVATGAAFIAIILALGAVSGAHLNPVMTLIDRAVGGLSTRVADAYIAAQATGGIVGAVLVNLMFGLRAIEISTHTRSAGGIWLGEVFATFGLALVVFGVVRSGRAGIAPSSAPAFVACQLWAPSSPSLRSEPSIPRRP